VNRKHHFHKLFPFNSRLVPIFFWILEMITLINFVLLFILHTKRKGHFPTKPGCQGTDVVGTLCVVCARTVRIDCIQAAQLLWLMPAASSQVMFVTSGRSQYRSKHERLDPLVFSSKFTNNLQFHEKAHLHTCNTPSISLQLYRVVPKQLLIHSKLPNEIYKLSPVNTCSWY
jgi:hypothetical protein